MQEYEIMAIIFCCAGLIFICVATSIKVYYRRRATKCTIETTGTVVDYKYKGLDSPGESQKTWHPVFEYYASGKMIRKISNIGTTRRTFEVGQKVTILYNPENESEYYVPEVTQGRSLGTVFIITGTIVTLCGILFWLKLFNII